MGETKGFGTEEHRERLDALKDEIDNLRQRIDAARCYVEDRRHLPDRRRAPRAFAGPDRRRTPSP